MNPSKSKKTSSDLRKFGLVMSIPALLVAAIMLWKGLDYWLVAVGIGALFAGLGLLYPEALGPVERAWMAIALKLSIVSTTIILSIAYYLILTPIGLFQRMMSRDALDIRGDGADSYWKPADHAGSGNRPYKPY